MKGPTFESFLEEEGIADEVYAESAKRVIAFQLSERMRAKNISKTAMSKLMKTSRPQLDRLLDPKNESVQLNTIQKAAAVLGLRVSIELHVYRAGPFACEVDLGPCPADGSSVVREPA